MLTALAFVALARQLGPIQFANVPTVTGGTIASHRVTFNIKNDQAKVSSDSRITMSNTRTVTIDILCSRMNGNPNPQMAPSTTVDKVQIPLQISSDQKDPGSFHAVGTILLNAGNHTLHTEYNVAAARTGLGQKQRTFAYGIGNGPTLGVVEFIYHYDQETVFNTPDMEPTDWKWETGKTGTYVRKENVQPAGELVFFTYYSAKTKED